MTLRLFSETLNFRMADPSAKKRIFQDISASEPTVSLSALGRILGKLQRSNVLADDFAGDSFDRMVVSRALGEITKESSVYGPILKTMKLLRHDDSEMLWARVKVNLAIYVFCCLKLA